MRSLSFVSRVGDGDRLNLLENPCPTDGVDEAGETGEDGRCGPWEDPESSPTISVSKSCSS